MALLFEGVYIANIKKISTIVFPKKKIFFCYVTMTFCYIGKSFSSFLNTERLELTYDENSKKQYTGRKNFHETASQNIILSFKCILSIV